MAYEDPNVLVPTPVEGHGSTAAAWFLVIVTTIGLIVTTVAFDTFHVVGMSIGIVIMLIGLVGGGVMKAMGFGKDGHRTKHVSHA